MPNCNPNLTLTWTLKASLYTCGVEHSGPHKAVGPHTYSGFPVFGLHKYIKTSAHAHITGLLVQSQWWLQSGNSQFCQYGMYHAQLDTWLCCVWWSSCNTDIEIIPDVHLTRFSWKDVSASQQTLLQHSNWTYLLKASELSVDIKMNRRFISSPEKPMKLKLGTKLKTSWNLQRLTSMKIIFKMCTGATTEPTSKWTNHCSGTAGAVAEIPLW